VDEETAPHLRRSVLLTIDMQNDFVLEGAPACVPGTLDVVPVLRGLVEDMRELSRPIVHVIRLYQPDGSDAELSRRATVRHSGPIVAPGSMGAELVDALKPEPAPRMDCQTLRMGSVQQIGSAEWIMYKPRWGAFYRTPLQEHLDSLGIDTVVVSGCNFPNCPRMTVYEASERDYRIALVRDATSGLYALGEQELERIGVSLLAAREIRRLFRV
jgi:nicotinamidase-related amidase